MFKGLKIFGFAAIVACSAGGQAFAQDQGCIVLKSVAEVEQVVVTPTGEKSTKLVPASTAVPGVEVIWTVTANNICKLPSDKVTINNAVPEHMTLVANSAMGPGSDITYSVDGKTFGTADQLTVKADGGQRQARADEYRHIRWIFKNSLQPGAQAFARFRAVLN
jgi:uncharacterized repeat protein (TIGR01451 family)